MPDFLEMTADKFVFKVATDRFYTSEGVWAKEENDQIRVGLTDFVQQRNGDVAFADVRPVGTDLSIREELASIETIKVTISYASPVSGKISVVNPAMDASPEAINQDPYGAGWLALVEAEDWDNEKSKLLDPQAYFELMKGYAEEETHKR